MHREWIAIFDGGIEYFDTEAEAVRWASDCIVDLLDDHWSSEVENIVVARVTHESKQTNVVTPDMLDEDREYNGRTYSGNFDFWCDYVMAPITDPA